jgi:hypothetical protein
MKLHYVYYAFTKNGKPKVGATSNPKRRLARYQSGKVLEAYECPWKCGDREIELQLQYFGKRDSNFHYAEWLEKKKNIDYSVFQTEEFSRKMSEANLKSYASGTRKEVDRSYINDEYKEKISKASKEMWKDPKRLESMPRGEEVANALLTNEQVIYIRRVGFSKRNQFTPVPPGKKSALELADELGVKKYIIKNVMRGKTYTSIK